MGGRKQQQQRGLIVGALALAVWFAPGGRAQEAASPNLSPTPSATATPRPTASQAPRPTAIVITPKPLAGPEHKPSPPPSPVSVKTPVSGPLAGPEGDRDELVRRNAERKARRQEIEQFLDGRGGDGALGRMLDRLPPGEDREAFRRNLVRWRDMPPEERNALRGQAEDRVDRIKAETEKALNDSGLRLSPDEQDVFALRYKQERRKLERSLLEQMNAERARRLPKIVEQLKKEFPQSPVTSPAPSPHSTAAPSPTPHPTAAPSPTPHPTNTPSPTPHPTAAPSPSLVP